jgi:hypothetical protein
MLRRAFVIGALLVAAGLGCAREACCEGGKAVSNSSTSAIWQVALTDPGIRAHVALEQLVSWPIPLRVEGGHAFAFFYYASWGPPPAKESKLYPPAWRVQLSPAGVPGKPERVEPRVLGIDKPAGEPFATHPRPTTGTVAEADARRAALLAGYDAVLPIWLARGSADQPPVVAFRKQFLALTEPPLLPVYLTMGPDFFTWLGIAPPAKPAP